MSTRNAESLYPAGQREGKAYATMQVTCHDTDDHHQGITLDPTK